MRGYWITLTKLEISQDDDDCLFELGTLLYYSAHVQMESFWNHIIQQKNTDGTVSSQERIFRMKPVNKLMRMTFVAATNTIYCVLEKINKDF